MAIKSYAILSGFTLMILLRNLVTFVLNFKKQNKHDYMRENEEREREREREDGERKTGYILQKLWK